MHQKFGRAFPACRVLACCAALLWSLPLSEARAMSATPPITVEQCESAWSNSPASATCSSFYAYVTDSNRCRLSTQCRTCDGRLQYNDKQVNLAQVSSVENCNGVLQDRACYASEGC